MKRFQNRHAELQMYHGCALRVLCGMTVLLLIIAEITSSAIAQGPPQYGLTILDEDHVSWPPEWTPDIITQEEGIRIRPHFLNDQGVAVGRAINLSPHHELAIMYVHAIGRMIDLNHLDNDAQWIDLETQATSDDWFARRATGINVHGHVVGNARKLTNGGERLDRFFVLRDPLGDAPTFELLPSVGTLGSLSNYCRINDDGLIAANTDRLIVYAPPYNNPIDIGVANDSVRDINNRGDFVAGGQIFERDTNDNYSAIYESANYYFSGINYFGITTGNQIYSRQGRDKFDGGPIRFDVYNESNPTLLKSLNGADTNRSGKVNFNGDIFFSHDEGNETFSRGFLFLDAEGDSFALDDYVVFDIDSPQDVVDWNSDYITASGINYSGQLLCYSQGKTFLLTQMAPEPGITVFPTSDLTTSESGGNDTFEVVLDTEPSADVTIGISSDNSAEGTVDASSLTFTPANWNTAQTVTITGEDDSVEDGDVAYTIVTAAATSTDPDYDGLDPDDVSVTNEDDEASSGGSAEYPSGAIGLTIPDNDPDGGLSSLITGVGNHDPLVLTVTLNISHPRPSDLEAFVTGPNGIPWQLFNVNGDNDLTGLITDTEGEWLLEVFDTRKKKDGTLQSWSITVDY